VSCCVRDRQSPQRRSKKLAIKEMKSMRTFLILAAAFSLAGLTAHAQSDNAVDPAIPDRSYKLLREDENWTFLRNRALRQDFWDPIKYIPLRSDANDWYLTIGGEVREVWEQIGNDNWGHQPYMNGYFNERYMPYFDIHYGRHFRTFVELKSGINSFRIGGPRPIDEKKLDFQAGFLEFGTFQRCEFRSTPCWQAGTRVRLRALD
jgi:hypothetical protein